MNEITLDNRKINDMSMDILKHFSGTGAHTVEVVCALAQAIGRIVVALGEAGMSDLDKRTLVDLAIKQIAVAIETGQKQIIRN